MFLPKNKYREADDVQKELSYEYYKNTYNIKSNYEKYLYNYFSNISKDYSVSLGYTKSVIHQEKNYMDDFFNWFNLFDWLFSIKNKNKNKNIIEYNYTFNSINYKYENDYEDGNNSKNVFYFLELHFYEKDFNGMTRDEMTALYTVTYIDISYDLRIYERYQAYQYRNQLLDHFMNNLAKKIKIHEELMSVVWHPKNFEMFKYLDPDTFDNDNDVI